MGRGARRAAENAGGAGEQRCRAKSTVWLGVVLLGPQPISPSGANVIARRGNTASFICQNSLSCSQWHAVVEYHADWQRVTARSREF